MIRITTTTICGTDVHIVRGEYPGQAGLVLGHEPVGVIEELGAGLDEMYTRRPARHRRRDHAVRAVLLLPERRALAVRRRARRLALRQHHQRRVGRVPARARRAREPRADSRRARPTKHVLLCPDIFSTGLSGAESGNIKVGDAVAVFAQGPIGLCATLGAKLKGASLIIGIDSVHAAARGGAALRRQRHAQHSATAIRCRRSSG